MTLRVLTYTIIVQSVTLTAEDSLIECAREVARRENKTLEAACHDWLVWYASRNVTREEIEGLYERLKHVKAGRKFTRDEMNER